jgi:hypothetical protein
MHVVKDMARPPGFACKNVIHIVCIIPHAGAAPTRMVQPLRKIPVMELLHARPGKDAQRRSTRAIGKPPEETCVISLPSLHWPAW